MNSTKITADDNTQLIESLKAKVALLEAEKKVLVDTYEAGLLADSERISLLEKENKALREQDSE